MTSYYETEIAYRREAMQGIGNRRTAGQRITRSRTASGRFGFARMRAAATPARVTRSTV